MVARYMALWDAGVLLPGKKKSLVVQIDGARGETRDWRVLPKGEIQKSIRIDRDFP